MRGPGASPLTVGQDAVMVVAALTATSIPVASAVVAGLFAGRLGGTCLARPQPHTAFWAIGFLLFAGAAAAEAYGASSGWSATTFRLYYLLGGILTVGFLGLGAAWLHLPRSWALFMTGAVLACVPAAAITVFASDVDPAALDVAGLRPPPNDALEGLAFLWAIALNTFGTVLLVGGSLRSIAAGRRRLANALIIVGILSVALSGTLTRLGSYGYVYLGQLVGIALVFAGFELAVRVPGRHPAAGPTAATASPT